MAYVNAVYYIDLENGVDARTALTTVTVANPSGTITRCTKVGHGLPTGSYATLSLFTAWLNGAWRITVVDADNFDLDGAVWQATADASGTVTPHGGSSMSDAWKTFLIGASAARIQPGDTIRVMASPEPTLIGSCAWTQYSKAITLPGAVTANITDCETAWTGSANVTQTADTAQFKENTKSAKSVIAAGFTTGLVAYFATGTLDLSGYQQVSFWIRNTVAVTAGMLELRLCSDTAGVTAVNTIAVPAIPSTSQWAVITVDTAGALGSAIASVALYVVTGPGSNTINLDDIIACKAASSADALTLNSLLGKKWNLPWAASTTYAVNDTYRPTQPNRNGFCYRVTAQTSASGGSEPTWPQEIGQTVVDGGVTWQCYDLEDSWFGIQSINGTTVKLDNITTTLGSAGRGYDGATETVATYKRECIVGAMGTNSATNINSASDSGSQTANITFTGGWNRTDMGTQTGETWYDGCNGAGRLHDQNAASFIAFNNLNGVRVTYGLFADGSPLLVTNCHLNSCTSGFYGAITTGNHTFLGASFRNCAVAGWTGYGVRNLLKLVAASNALGGGFMSTTNSVVCGIYLSECRAKNNGGYGLTPGATPLQGSNVITANNASGPIDINFNAASAMEHFFYNSSFGETMQTITALTDRRVYSSKNGRVADAHLITTDGGTIASATDQRHTASGISWKFLPTSTNRAAGYPLRLSVAKIAVAASALVTLSIWTRRDSTDIKGQLLLRGGQIAGVPTDVTVACEPSINTWTQSGNLTFTPTEAGVVEVEFVVWDGVGTTNAFWIDDFAKVQA